MSQIVKLSSRIQDTLRSDAPQKDKDRQVAVVQAQIEALQARMAELVRQQAEREAQGRTEGSPRAACVM